eukprot:CAMPEP_0116132998 /NCGR_PEP_ID=MMETSP0329-20121206/9864_1 /TAXON_ID=697910 /ORGANISM="Pseudo-nitzschia arenysensis, Strain B593" /LENGTH=659 /DNA_ID=CAMNT_0003627585 /DNA_START=68 /DNA_END=2047 /DNA_ORIENTATION=-
MTPQQDYIRPTGAFPQSITSSTCGGQSDSLNGNDHFLGKIGDFETNTDSDNDNDAENIHNGTTNSNSNSNSNGFNRFWNAKAETTTQSESVDSILAKELNKLSFRERESINDEIHGIDVDRKYIEESGAVEETPEILSKSLNDMQSELDWLCSTESGIGGSAVAFNRSQQLFGTSSEGTYINTTDFRLMFLRCERFDCKKAAQRLCRFADLMSEIYGDFALQRPTRLSDLDDDEIALLKSGWSQIFPGRDRAGRRIYSNFADDRGLKERSRLRVPVYVLMSLLSNDIESQRRGFVAVMWMHNIKKMDVGDFISRGKTQNRGVACTPIRVGAGHYCFPTIESAKDAAFSQVISRLAGQIRPHIRIHSGSPIECVYILESFGIPSKQHPLEIATGTLKLTNHTRWLKLCAARETSPTNLKHIIECPNHSDILFGRGQVVMNHPGNNMFRNFIQCNLEVYSNIQTKKESTQWTWGVVRKLKSDHGARFLKEEQIDADITAWVEVSNEVARSKVRIAFRDARTRQTRSLEKEAKTVVSNGSSIARKHNQARGGGIFGPKPIPPSSVPSSSSIFLSKRKNPIMTISNDLFNEQEQQINAAGVNLNQISSSLTTLTDQISQLNNNLNALVQVSNDSSTSDFLGLDGSNSSKRQRLDSNKKCFDYF